MNTCPTCNTTQHCSGSEVLSCWCEKYPPLLSIEGDRQCLCEQCLLEKIRAKAEDFVNSFTREGAANKAVKFKDYPVIEGLDYYISSGFWVFTAWYHLRRGYCCGNGCLHCPYGHVNVSK